MKLVILQYSFMFDPSDVWSRMSSFESDFADFLKTKGLEAEMVTPVGASASRVLFIQKAPDPVVPIAPELKVKENLKNLRDPKTYTSPKSYK